MNRSYLLAVVGMVAVALFAGVMLVTAAPAFYPAELAQYFWYDGDAGGSYAVRQYPARDWGFPNSE